MSKVFKKIFLLKELEEKMAFAAPVSRFAPSPTGFLHLGHLAHMLYLWGISRSLNGKVFLRIEDHDNERTKKILRESFALELPTTILERRDKKGWNCPTSDWLSEGLYDQIMTYCGPYLSSELSLELKNAANLGNELPYQASENLWMKLIPSLTQSFLSRFQD